MVISPMIICVYNVVPSGNLWHNIAPNDIFFVYNIVPNDNLCMFFSTSKPNVVAHGSTQNSGPPKRSNFSNRRSVLCAGVLFLHWTIFLPNRDSNMISPIFDGYDHFWEYVKRFFFAIFCGWCWPFRPSFQAISIFPFWVILAGIWPFLFPSDRFWPLTEFQKLANRTPSCSRECWSDCTGAEVGVVHRCRFHRTWETYWSWRGYYQWQGQTLIKLSASPAEANLSGDRFPKWIIQKNEAFRFSFFFNPKNNCSLQTSILTVFRADEKKWPPFMERSEYFLFSPALFFLAILSFQIFFGTK